MVWQMAFLRSQQPIHWRRRATAIPPSNSNPRQISLFSLRRKAGAGRGGDGGRMRILCSFQFPLLDRRWTMLVELGSRSPPAHTCFGFGINGQREWLLVRSWLLYSFIFHGEVFSCHPIS